MTELRKQLREEFRKDWDFNLQKGKLPKIYPSDKQYSKWLETKLSQQSQEITGLKSDLLHEHEAAVRNIMKRNEQIKKLSERLIDLDKVSKEIENQLNQEG